MVHAASSLLLYDNDQAPRASVVTLATRAFGRAVAPALAGLEFGPIYVSTERGNGQGGASEQRGWYMYAQPSIDSRSKRGTGAVGFRGQRGLRPTLGWSKTASRGSERLGALAPLFKLTILSREALGQVWLSSGGAPLPI